MKRIRILHIALNAPNEPNDGIEKGFRNNDVEYLQIDWIKYHDYKKLNEDIIYATDYFEPDIIFMQIQTANVIDNKTAEEISKRSFVVNWTGDVREDINWYSSLAPFVDLTLFTNETDIKKMKEVGHSNVDYLQIGYDSDIYKKGINMHRYPSIVFLGNNYKNRIPKFPLTQERLEMVNFLKETFGESFQVYGLGWEGARRLFPNEESTCYNNCDIAINQNHFDYERFSSDRIFRIMASGAMCLTKYYKGIELEFVPQYHLDVWFDFGELKEKIDYYLGNEKQRKDIADAGCDLVTKKYNWTERVKELFEICKKHDTKNKIKW